MSPKVKPIPERYRSITPNLVCRNAVEAIEFYKRAFNGTEEMKSLGPDGKTVMHAEVRIGNSVIMIVDENPEWDCLSPQSLNGTPVWMNLYVDDADATFDSALKAGATVKMPLADQFWGDRYGTVVDPYGHQWAIATRIKDMTPEEMKKASEEFFASVGG